MVSEICMNSLSVRTEFAKGEKAEANKTVKNQAALGDYVFAF